HAGQWAMPRDAAIRFDGWQNRLIASARREIWMAIEKNELRRVMGHFATGVTVITARRSSGELHGLTANAFTSVSLVPPLALVCVDKKAESYPCFEESKIFTVNVLARDQEALSRKFAISGGNHTIYIAEVEQAETPREGKPLLFFRGGYRELGD